MATAGAIRAINEDKMHAFLGKVVGDFGAALSSALVYIRVADVISQHDARL